MALWVQAVCLLLLGLTWFGVRASALAGYADDGGEWEGAIEK